MRSTQRIIGVDESGKGDFFGPLVIAALLADQDQRTILTDLGVKDSKVIADKKLLGIDAALRERFSHAVIVVTPEDYNRRYKQIKNLNKLLAWGHTEAIAAVLASHEADLVILDKFGKSELVEKACEERRVKIPLRQIVRGEEIPQVAAASILARAAFIREMDRLSLLCGVRLPKGAGPPVDRVGREIVSSKGTEILNLYAKTHFKNYQRAVAHTLFA